jgi:hypothetical protein
MWSIKKVLKLQLMQVPKLGEVVADRIVKRYPTPVAFRQALLGCGGDVNRVKALVKACSPDSQAVQDKVAVMLIRSLA